MVNKTVTILPANVLPITLTGWCVVSWYCYLSFTLCIYTLYLHFVFTLCIYTLCCYLWYFLP